MASGPFCSMTGPLGRSRTKSDVELHSIILCRQDQCGPTEQGASPCCLDSQLNGSVDAASSPLCKRLQGEVLKLMDYESESELQNDS